MVPTPGRIVEYTLNAYDAEVINQRRADARRSNLAARQSGAVIHYGNQVSAEETYPMIITRVWAPATEGSSVNGQVLLDGNDTYWVTSRLQGDGPFEWRPYPRT